MSRVQRTNSLYRNFRYKQVRYNAIPLYDMIRGNEVGGSVSPPVCPPIYPWHVSNAGRRRICCTPAVLVLLNLLASVCHDHTIIEQPSWLWRNPFLLSVLYPGIIFGIWIRTMTSQSVIKTRLVAVCPLIFTLEGKNTLFFTCSTRDSCSDFWGSRFFVASLHFD